VNVLSSENCAGVNTNRSPVVLLGIISEATDETMCPGVGSASKKLVPGKLLGVKAACA
jgi:hypothetical protein